MQYTLLTVEPSLQSSALQVLSTAGYGSAAIPSACKRPWVPFPARQEKKVTSKQAASKENKTGSINDRSELKTGSQQRVSS